MTDTKHTPTPWKIIENMAPYMAKIDIYPANAKDGTLLDDIRIARVKLKIAPTNGELQAVGALNDAIRSAEADAAFIVRACNAHEPFIEWLEKRIEWLDSERRNGGSWDYLTNKMDECKFILEKFNALAKAGAA